MAVVSSTSVHSAFKKTQYEPHRKIWNRIQAEKTLVKNAQEGVQWVREKDNFEFIHDGPVLDYLAMQRLCGLRVGKRIDLKGRGQNTKSCEALLKD